MAELQTDHHNAIKNLAPHLTGIGTEPRFAIGQRALLIQSPEGNILWDCISLIDEPTIAAIKALGGIYGGWWDLVVMSEAKTAVHRSAERYLKAIEPAA